MVDIVFDTGVVIGYGWTQDESYPYCCRFFKKFPVKDHSFYYPKKVKEELTHVRMKIARENAKYEYELRLLHRFIQEFIHNARKLNYDRSKYNWDLIFDAVAGIMMIYLIFDTSNLLKFKDGKRFFLSKKGVLVALSQRLVFTYTTSTSGGLSTPRAHSTSSAPELMEFLL